MKYEIFHSGYWEKELFLAPCQPRRTIPLLGFPAGLWYSPHTRVRLALSWSTRSTSGGLGRSLVLHSWALWAPVLCPPNSSHFGFSTISAPSPLFMRPTGSAGLLLPFPGAGISLQTGSWETVGLPRHFPFLTDHCPLLSYVPCLERCCFICKLGFRCFRWQGKSGPYCSTLTRKGCLFSLWIYGMSWIIWWGIPFQFCFQKMPLVAPLSPFLSPPYREESLDITLKIFLLRLPDFSNWRPTD